MASSTGGMPDWKVNEPNIDLRLHDEPLAYQSSVSRVSFQIDYWQRDDRTPSANVFTLGPGWECSWQSYIDTDGTTYDPVTLYGTSGGEIQFSDLSGATPNYYYNLRMQSLTDTNGNLSGFEVLHSSGAVDYYNFLATDSYGNVTQAYLSQKIDEHGHATTFVYTPFNPATGAVQLLYVVDPDGKTNTLSYTTNASYNCLISQVQDPFGHTASFAYDTNGYLTTVTDEAGLSSSFGYADVAVGNDYFYMWYGYYETNHWLDQLTTPYGTTSFSFTDEGLEIDPYDLFYLVYYGDLSSILRSVVVTEPNGSHQMFAYNSYVTFAWDNVNTTNIPSSTPDGSLLDDGAYLVYRNSFYWGRQQFANLSATFLATGATNWDLTQLTDGDFLNGRWQHWLHSSDGGQSDALSMEQDPSPDGSTPGEMTWFTYPGQPPGGVYDLYGNQASYFQGTSISPTLTIKMLPDGSQWYQQYQMDQWGNKTNVISTYSAGGSVLTRTNSYVYAANGVDLLQTIGADGVTTATVAYDASHQPLSVTNALGEVTHNIYNANEQTTSTTTSGGLVTTNIFGADGFLAQQITIGFSTNRYTYSNGWTYTHTDERGLTVTNSWDALRRLTKVSYPDGTSIAYTYNKLDLAKVVDRMGFTTSYGYNAIRQKIFETNALGNVTSYTYCDCGALESVTDPIGNVTHFTHDNQGNLVNVNYPDGYSITNQYNLIRQLMQRADSSGAVWNYTFNNQGLPITVSNLVGQLAAYAYDIDDRKTNEVDANGVSVSMAYDNLNRLLTRSYPNSSVEGYGYSPNVSGPTSETNQIGNVTLYGYDALNRKTSEVHPGVTTNQFTYNSAGDLLVLTDGRNNTTSWHFDTFGRATNKLDALNRVMFSYTFNPNGWLTNRWTPEKGNTAYSFDNVGNLKTVSYLLFSNYYSYDALNHLTNMVDATGTNRLSYDAAGQLLSEGGLWANDMMAYSYTNRLRTGLSIGSSWSQNYSYDSARRLSALTSPAGSFGYVAGGMSPASALIQEIYLPNGATITNGYDALARLTQTSLNNHWGHTLDGYNYQINAIGMRTNIVRNLGLTSSSVNANYDGIGQLTSWRATEANGQPRLHEQQGWAYDPAGNLQFRTNGALVQTFAVDAVNELTNITRNGTFTVSGATPAPATNVTVNGAAAQIYGDFTFASTNHTLANGNNSFTNVARNVYGATIGSIFSANLPASVTLQFDANGNLTNDGLHLLTYDAENRIASVVVASNFRKDFLYDGLSRLRIRREYSWTGSTWTQTNETRFVWDGNVIVQLRTSNNVPTLTLTRGLDLSGSLQGAGGTGGLLAMTDGGGTNYYYHADGIGNITALMDAQENIVGRREYDAYYRTINLTGNKTGLNPFWASSQLLDTDTGFYHYKYRIYVPSLQCWASRDPLGERGFEMIRKTTKLPMRAREPNLYKFVANNPVKYFDSLGLDMSNPGCQALQAQLDFHSAVAAYDESFGNYQGWAEEAAICMELAQMMEEAGCNDPPPPPAPSCPAPAPAPPSRGFNPPRGFWPMIGIGIGIGVTCVICPECCAIGVLAGA